MLAVTVVGADGRTKRLAGDEPDPRDIPQGLRFGTSNPGGFKDCTFTLARRADISYHDLALYDTLRVHGPGGRVAWEGRIAQMPASRGNEDQIQIGGVGWQAALKDDETFRALYRHIALGEWEGPGTGRRINILDGGQVPGDPQVTPDRKTGIPALALSATQPWVAAGAPQVEGWLDAGGGLAIAKVYYEWRQRLDQADTNWSWKLRSSDDDDALTGESTGELRGGGPSTGTFVNAIPRRYAVAQLVYSGAKSGGDGKTPTVFFTHLAAYGNHGLEVVGDEPEAGLRASDIIAHAIANGAPALQFTTGLEGTIDQTDFPIPHLTFLEGTTAADVIEAANAYQLKDWFVWEDKTFYYRTGDPGVLTWEARQSDGAQSDIEGPQADDLYNRVVVVFQNNAGMKITVGPPDYEWGNDTDEALWDTSDSNELNRHGFKRWKKLEIGFVTSKSAAIQLGRLWLLEASQPQYRGTLVLPRGAVRHPRRVGVPDAWEVRGDSFVRVMDLESGSDVAHRVIETTYDRDRDAVTVSVDNTTHKVEALFERLQIAVSDLVG